MEEYYRFFLKFAFPNRPCSLKDRITDSGSVGPGSIPSGGTKKPGTAPGFFVLYSLFVEGFMQAVLSGLRQEVSDQPEENHPTAKPRWAKGSGRVWRRPWRRRRPSGRRTWRRAFYGTTARCLLPNARLRQSLSCFFLQQGA